MKNRLALYGGRPVRSRFLRFHRSTTDKEEEKAVVDVLRSGWLTRGPATERFENAFSKYVRSRYALALNSCTAALHLALAGTGIKSGEEVITTPTGFASSANVIVHQGAKPVFVDVEEDTLNMDPERIESKINKKTRAILPVDFAGHPCEIERINRIARKYGLVTIEDAAHSLGAEFKGKKVGPLMDLTAFSFYATKNITTGEGGMLTTNNKRLIEKVRPLSLHGISRDAWDRYGLKGYRHWNIEVPGYKYNMFDLQAALGIEQLKKIDKFWEKRFKCVQVYNKAFGGISEISTLSSKRYVKNAHHLYVIILKTELLKTDRDTILNAIQAENIGVGVHFRAIHLHPYYKKRFKFKRGMFPNAEYSSDRVISLPLYPSLTNSDLRDVISAVKKVIAFFRK